MKNKLLLTVITTVSLSSTAANAAVATFDNLALAPESYFAPQTATTFNSGDATFTHNFTDYGYGCCWSGFTYSNTTDTTTAGYTNQYSAITGGGVNGSANYAIGNPGAYGVSRLDFAAPTMVEGAYFTNTTYAYLSMRDGDNFAKQFGLGDFFTLTVTGLDAADTITNAINISLARDANLVDMWIWYDLMPLGEVSALEFSLSSSDNGDYGMNTPAYFAMDNLTTVTAVPVPAAVWLFSSGLLGLVGVARRRG